MLWWLDVCLTSFGLVDNKQYRYCFKVDISKFLRLVVLCVVYSHYVWNTCFRS